MTKEARGWYIRRGHFAIKLLQGESAIVWSHGNGIYVQFDNLELPTRFTQPVLMNKSEIVLEVVTVDSKITLEYLGKRYSRTVRKDYFDFHGVECKA